jgi:hypothetical protein
MVAMEVAEDAAAVDAATVEDAAAVDAATVEDAAAVEDVAAVHCHRCHRCPCFVATAVAAVEDVAAAVVVNIEI